jgi:hypothetical protein
LTLEQRPRSRVLEIAGPAALALVGVAFILRSYRAEHLRAPSRHFAADTPSSLGMALGLLVVETLLLYAILRPWSYRASRERLLAALALFGPWAIFWCFRVMHAGTAMLLHTMWLVLLDVALLVCLMAWPRRLSITTPRPR